MPPTDRQVRVFISSTFRDMHAERDHLVTVVFPELRERVESLGLEFFDVDLRWGVPETGVDGEKANSWEYCKRWIDRVEPFFVCMLGQRYGWVPKPHEIKDDEDRQLWAGRSVTDMEIRHAVFSRRVLRRSSFYLRETLVPEPPRTDPATYGEFVGTEPDSIHNLEQLKAEIGACDRPVRPYACRWGGKSFEDLDAFGRLVLDDLWSGVLRDERYVSKEVWQQALGGDPDRDPSYTDESTPVPPDLAAKLVALAKPPPKDPLVAEREQMEAFAQTRLRWFQGRTHELQQLAEFIASTDETAPRLAVVAAAPGQGKSALIAKLHQQLSKGAGDSGNQKHPRETTDFTDDTDRTQESVKSVSSVVELPFLITHFVGATERSATVHALVERLLGELDRSGIAWPTDEQKEGEEPKRDFNSLCNRLRQRLGDYSGDRRIVILLDALNQLTDGHDLHWLPNRLGPGVRVVVSCIESEGIGCQASGVSADKACTPEQRVLHALSSRQPVPLRVPLGPLTEDDIRTIVVEYLKEYCHELDRQHLDALCAIPQARNPLYLLVMLNELRTLGGNDLNVVVPARIASMSSDYPDTVALFRWVLQRLEVFGAEAVKWWCLYLAHGRVGMASHELADLLARKLGADARTTALRIERGLRRYLLRRGGQLDFFHSQLRHAVMEEYGESSSRRGASQRATCQIHGEMADYFTACAKGTDPQEEWETDGVRGFSECVFHLTKAGQHEQAAGLLTSFPFLLHKLRVGLLEGVFEDYNMVRQDAPPDVVKRLEVWADFSRDKAHILRRGNDEWPAHKILLQLSVEHADDSPLTIAAQHWLTDDRCDWLWLRRVTRLPHAQKNPSLAVFEGHTAQIDGALSLVDGRLLSWSWDKTLRLWDGQKGVCLAVLAGHAFGVRGALVLPGGRFLSWAGFVGSGNVRSAGDPLRMWDTSSGECVMVLEGHSVLVLGALALHDGRLLSWSSDRTLRIWDPQSGKCHAILEGHSNWVNGALALPDDRILSWSSDKTLRLWDSKSRECLAVLEGHSDVVTSALALPNGPIISWAGDDESQDHALRLWHSLSGQCLGVFNGHCERVCGALALPDSRFLSWSSDKTMRLWNIWSSQCLAVFEGHFGGIKGALLMPNGRILSWSWDKTLRLWDSQSGECRVVFKGHSGGVNGAQLQRDDCILSWSEDGTLRLWDSEVGHSQDILMGHSCNVGKVVVLSDRCIVSWADNVVISEDHRHMGFSFEDLTLRVWDSQTGECRAVLDHPDWIIGALLMLDGRILSWSSDRALRLWDIQSSQCVTVLEGHSDRVNGALLVPDGRVLSWAEDKTLRMWDSQSGQCHIVLAGHSAAVIGAVLLPDGRILSWAGKYGEDPALRVWDSRTGQCRSILKGHSGRVNGAQVMRDGRILSWSQDKTLRLWDSESGHCSAVLEGHTDDVTNALALPDDRILSWASGWKKKDHSLRLWDSQTGQCCAVLEGHSDWVVDALVLPDARILSWGEDKSLRLWDKNGRPLSAYSTDEGLRLFSELRIVYRRTDDRKPFFVWDRISTQPRSLWDHSVNTGLLRLFGKGCELELLWNGESRCTAQQVLPDGTAILTQDNGQVCILKLHHGNRRISLAEAEALLALPKKVEMMS